MILKNGKRLDGMGDSMPIGSVIEYNGTDIPDGWEILPGDANVYIGASAPSEGQEAWIIKGKNLVNNNVLLWEEGHYAMENGWKAGYGGERIRINYLIPVSPDTTYYANTFNDEYNFVIRAYDKDKNFTYSIGGIGNGDTFTTNSTAYYIGVALYSPSATELTYDTYLSMIKDFTIKPFICLASEPDKNYEPYIAKEIRIKNTDNNTYTEFYKEERYNKNIYSFDEHVIGTWVDGRPLYRKIVVCGALPNSAEKKTPHLISNLDLIVSMYGVAKKPGYVFTLPFSSTDPSASMYVFVNDGDVVIGTGKDRTGFTESYITLEYVKTIN